MKPTIGRIVLYRPSPADGFANEEVERPAIVVAVHSETCVSLQVFTAGRDDGIILNGEFVNVLCKTSVSYSEEKSPRSWYWPPRD